MPLFRGVVRLVGWLLTPLVAWAASFLGSTLGALLAAGMGSARGGLWITAGLGGLFALTSAWGWLRFLKRSPKLQQTLAVAPDGTPLAALEENSSPPVAE